MRTRLAVAVLATPVLVGFALAGCSTSPHPPRAVRTTPGAAPAGAWLQYHADDGHSGAVATTPLTPAQATWVSPTLDGDVYGEPLYADGLILAATINDTVYGLDPTSGAVRWSTHAATPVAVSNLPCGDVDPLGILSTPVVDQAAHRIYVVAEEQTLGGVQHELLGLSTTSGAITMRKVVDPPGMNVITQQQRGALMLDQGRVVVPFGGLDGDCGQYHGWLVAANEDGSGGLLSYHTPGNEVGMWAASGPVQDSAGDIYADTGNGSSGSTYDQGNSVLKFSPTLQLLDYFAVPDWASDNVNDADLGSAGPILLSNGLLFVAGKPGRGFLVNTSHLGGVGGQRFDADVGCASFGGQAWAPPVLYVTCDNGPVEAFNVDTNGATFSPLWTSSDNGGPPIVAGGAVWAEDAGGGRLNELDPASGATLQVVVAADRQLHAFAGIGGPALPAWSASSDAGVDSLDGAPFYGSAGAVQLARPIVGIASTPDHKGYWLVASDGGIFSFGDAVFHGSTGAIRLNRPIVGMASTPDGRGYWLVASDGGIFAFGDAPFLGSTGAIRLAEPIVGMAAGPGGYWFVASDGGIFSFGVPFLGSAAGAGLGAPVVGMAAGSGPAYIVLAANGAYQLISSGVNVTLGGAQGAAPFVGVTAAG
jgi:outer membrane protein assembly factor BamB